MQDREILDRIAELVGREHHLETEHGTTALSPAQLEELKDLEVKLDQCWDLLRQRRARREFGQNPDQAEVRPEGTVESYRQ